MTSWQLTRILAGSMLLVSVALGAPGSPFFHSANWLWLTAFVGVNLLQSGVTRWCLMERLWRAAGLKAGD